MNRYVQETGVDNLPAGEEGCRDAEWARELADTDLAKMLRASTEPMVSFIAAATSPLSAPQATRINGKAARTDAWGMLVYSQSTDPESDHYADLTQLYSDKGWVDLPFCIEDVEAEQIGATLEVSE